MTISTPVKINGNDVVTGVYTTNSNYFYYLTSDGILHKRGTQYGILPSQTQIGAITDVSWYAGTLYVLTSDHKLFGAGSNNHGQLGDGTTNNSNTYIQIGDGLGNIVDVEIANSASFMCFLTEDGKLYGTGYNQDGVMANGEYGSSAQDVLSPIQISSPSHVVSKIAAVTSKNIFYITSSGDLYVTGSNYRGMGGIGNTNYATTPTLVTTNVDSVYTYLAPGSQVGDTILIKNNGTLYGMGNNRHGELGTGNTTEQNTPVRIGSTLGTVEKAWMSVPADSNDNRAQVFFITDDGKLYVAGFYVATGTGATADIKTPMQTGMGLPTILGGYSYGGTNAILTEMPYHTVTPATDGTAYGSLSSDTPITDIPDGTAVTITPTATGSTLSIGSIATITATPETDTAQYDYGFTNWTVNGTAISSGYVLYDSVTIQANFSRTEIRYTVTLTDDSTGYGTVSPSSVTPLYGTVIDLSSASMTIESTLVTATPETDTAQYDYSFTGWTINGSPAPSSYTVTADVTIQANFSRVIQEYTATIVADPSGYGTVSGASLTQLPYGTAVSISDNVITIGSTPITATPAADTAQYDYSFTSWTIAGATIPSNYTISGDVTITANFSRSVQEYIATIESNNTTWGTVSTGTVPNIPYGTVLHLGQDDSLIIGNVADPIATITVSPAAQTVRYTYAFTGYDVQDGDVITADQTIVATFSQTERTYTVSVLTNDQTRGTVYPVVILNVPGETYFQVSGQTITLDSQSSTATIASPTAQYTYAFDGWFTAASGGSAITNSTQVLGDMDVYAVFSATINTYTVTASVSPSGYGSLDTPSLASVPYGTLITVSGNVATVGSTPITATPAAATAQYTYSFVKWQYDGQDIGVSATVEANGSLSAVFARTVNTYTITWDVDGATTQETYEYGQTPSTAAPTKPNYTFNGWTPSIHDVTGDQTYTATWYATTYTITWDPTVGSFPGQPSHTATTTGTVETPAPTPTNDPVFAHYDFVGWFTAVDGGDELVTPYYPTANATWYAHWTPTIYTITFDANGGTTEATTLDGSAESPIVLPDAEPPTDSQHFAGWFTDPLAGEFVGMDGGYYVPTASITVYAQFADNRDYDYSLYLNPNTGYGGMTINVTSQTGAPIDITLPSFEPVKYLMGFAGWATTPDAEEAEYQPGDAVSVPPEDPMTLYAIWTDTPEHEDFKGIIGVIPILAGVGIVLGAAGMLYSKSRRTQLTTKDFMTATLGIAISVIVLALVLVPIIGNL